MSMIAIARVSPKNKINSDWHAGLLAMMPRILCNARRAFRNKDGEAQAEAVQEIVVSTLLAYFRLYQRGKVHLAFPGILTRFAIAQFSEGRRVSGKMKCGDVLSPCSRRRKLLKVVSLHDSNREGEPWRNMLVEDRHAGPAETAAARIDFTEWLASMKHRDRQIAEALSQGSTTQDVAKQFRVSTGRISQKRREFHDSWRHFHGE